jgi:hypothetical protein
MWILNDLYMDGYERDDNINAMYGVNDGEYGPEKGTFAIGLVPAPNAGMDDTSTVNKVDVSSAYLCFRCFFPLYCFCTIIYQLCCVAK